MGGAHVLSKKVRLKCQTYCTTETQKQSLSGTHLKDDHKGSTNLRGKQGVAEDRLVPAPAAAHPLP